MHCPRVLLAPLTLALVTLPACFEAGDAVPLTDSESDSGSDSGPPATTSAGSAPSDDGSEGPVETGSTTASETTGQDGSTSAMGSSSDADSGSEEGSSSEDESGDPPEPFCGDGDVNGEETCDDGVNAGLTEGDCSPDCAAIIQRKIIRLSQDSFSNTFPGGMTPVQFADEQCPIGYAALFVDGSNRVATLLPNMGNGQVDWVLQPWTEYVNMADERMWTTTELRLLGVGDDNQWVGLENALTDGVDFGKTGMRGDYTTSTMNCTNYTGTGSLAFGQTHQTTALAIGPADDSIGGLCGISSEFICVEQ